MAGGSSRRYPPELRERAVRMVAEISGQHDSEWAAISEVRSSARGWLCRDGAQMGAPGPSRIGGPTRFDGFKLGKHVIQRTLANAARTGANPASVMQSENDNVPALRRP